MTQAQPPRFAVTDAQIAAVIDEFYAVVQQHPGLGPVFAAHVHDWDAHKTKITAFWRNAIRSERGYDGNPMQVHKDAGDVRPGMFIPWFALFDAVLTRNLPPQVAAPWSDLAHRIGRGMAYGLVSASGPQSLRPSGSTTPIPPTTDPTPGS
jgi:hemoglobin